ncbi:putative phosphatidylinositol 4-phosphate 5-kinase 6-like [Capsicum annuum]|nr:putative phosphatidylinositol 4-phosphate 5-kinase 6-like [Capsicum annuum]
MGSLACSWLTGSYPSRTFFNLPSSTTTTSSLPCFTIYCCNSDFTSQLSKNDLKFVLHDALDAFDVNTNHARIAREGFCSQIRKLSTIERETSICINRGVDLGKAALHIAAEDDSLVSHSSVPLPVDDFLERLDHLSMGYCSRYSSSFASSPEHFIHCLEKYLYVNKGFRRNGATSQSETRALYLHSVLTHRCGSASLLLLLYSEILKMLRLWGFLSFDIEVFFPHDSLSSPRGYCKQKTKESDQLRVMTTQSLLKEMLTDLKDAFWPFQLDRTKSPFLRAARAANCSESTNNSEESAFELASVKAALHRLERGVWTSVRFGDMRRALAVHAHLSNPLCTVELEAVLLLDPYNLSGLSLPVIIILLLAACERLILLQTDPRELRDYGVLLYHCGFYKEALHYFTLYQDEKNCVMQKESFGLIDNVEEEEAMEKLMIRLNLILMEEDALASQAVLKAYIKTRIAGPPPLTWEQFS